MLPAPRASAAWTSTPPRARPSRARSGRPPSAPRRTAWGWGTAVRGEFIRLLARVRTVFRGWSGASGRIRVIDRGPERRLIVRGDTLSIYRIDGNWTPVRREYWWKALEAVALPQRP